MQENFCLAEGVSIEMANIVFDKTAWKVIKDAIKHARLVKRGSQTACNRKHGYHDSCTLCKGKRHVPMSSDFVAS